MVSLKFLTAGVMLLSSVDARSSMRSLSSSETIEMPWEASSCPTQEYHTSCGAFLDHPNANIICIQEFQGFMISLMHGIGIELEIDLENEVEVEVEVNLLGIHVEVELERERLGLILIGVFPTFNMRNVKEYIVAMKQSINAKYPNFLAALYLWFGQLDQQKELIILLGSYLFIVCE